MTWFKVDDSFHSHPKVLASRPAALGLWVVAGSWSSANLTDGFIADQVLPRLLPGAVKLAKELVSVGLWKRTKGGYLFHDWDVFQPSAEAEKAKRQARAEAGRKGGLASGKTRSQKRVKESQSQVSSPESQPDQQPDDDAPAHENADSGPRTSGNTENAGSNPRSNGEANASGVASRLVEPPSRPVPSRPVYGVDVGKSSSLRNARDEDDDDLHLKIDQRIITVLAEETGTTVTADWAARIRQRILDDRNVDRPLKYVTESLRRDPRKFLPAAVALPGLPAGLPRSTTDERVEQAQALKALFRAQANPPTIQGEAS